jgi:hypothetical protein
MSKPDCSSSTQNLEAAMLKIQGEIVDPAPNRKSHFARKGENDYADLQAMLKTIRPLCAKHGVKHGIKTAPRGDEWVIFLTLSHPESGEWDNTNMLPYNPRLKPMERMSEKTYASRQLYSQEFGICVDRDDDGHMAQQGTITDTETRKQKAKLFLQKEWSSCKTDEQRAKFAIGASKTVESGLVTQEFVSELMEATVSA